MLPIKEKFLLHAFGQRCLKHTQVNRYKTELAAFLQSSAKLIFPPSDNAQLSVVIPVYNGAFHTFRCLRSLLEDKSITLQVIVYDDGSTDSTNALMKRCENVLYVKGERNLGVVGAINAGASHATSPLLLLMNNDTTLAEGRLSHAASILRADLSVGAVGVRIRLASGKLQEAGAMLFSDGTTLGYLRDQKPNDLRGLFRRDVDYCSSAFMMLRTQQFLGMGGLDEAYAPAYYDETDLVMRMKAQNLRVVYSPRITVDHFEFGSQKESAARDAMAVKRQIFIQRWHTELASHGYSLRNIPDDIYARRHIPPPRHLFVTTATKYFERSPTREYQCVFVLGPVRPDWAKHDRIYGESCELASGRHITCLRDFVRSRPGYFQSFSAAGVDLPAL